MLATKPPKSKPRLGRGLSSLISISEVPIEIDLPAQGQPYATQGQPYATQPETPHNHPHNNHSPLPTANSAAPPEPAPPDGNVILHLPLPAILPNPHQPRQVFDEEPLAELAASIKSTGLIQPIVVRKLGADYQLISGERRLRAAKLAKLKTIPVIVREVDAVTQAQMALIENIQRQDLNPIDRAAGYRTLIDQLGLTQAELATRLGEDRSSIANFLRLLELAEPAKASLREGKLSLGHAKIIAGVTDILEQERLANLVVLQGLSVRNLERLVAQGPPKTTEPAPAPSQSPHLADLEKSLSRQLGLRVQVRSAARKGRGRLVIHYGSLDQFDELLNRLGCRVEVE